MLWVFILFALLMVLLFAGAPVGISMIIVAMLGLWALTGSISGTALLVANSMFTFTNSHAMIVVLMFVALGELAAVAGLSSDLFTMMNRVVGRFKGGTALATNFAAAGFAAITGSTTSATMAMCRVALPELRKFGYRDEISTGIIAACGTFAAMIPPSIFLVIYGILTNQSISRLLLAGIVPGILMAVLYALRIYIRRLVSPELFPPGAKFTAAEQVESIIRAFPSLAIVIIIITGILTGLWTATEAGGIGVMLIFLLALYRRQIGRREIVEVARTSLITTASLFTVIIGSMLLSRFLAFSGLTESMVGAIVGLELQPWVFFLCLMLAYVVLGMFLEGIGMAALTLPIVLPIVIANGWDPIWFGIVFTVIAEIALLTPPIGLNLYVIRSVAPDVPIGTVIKGVLFLLPADILMLALLYTFPQIALWLPNYVFG
ncbi:MAG: TRAP transporter large permease [Rhizobiaceae bacterium]